MNQNEINMDNLNENDNDIGPIELNLWDKIEEGLKNGISDHNSVQLNETTLRYKNKKKIINVFGFINVNNLYNEYIFYFLCKIVLMIAFLFNLMKDTNDFNFKGIILIGIVMVSWVIILDIVKIIKYNNISKNIRNQYFYDFLSKISFVIFLLGIYLHFNNNISVNLYLLLFLIPHFITSVFFYFLDPVKNEIVSKNKFILIECTQYCIILLKLSLAIKNINWFYFLFYFNLVSFFLILIGIMLLIISIFSFYGYLNNYLSSYKSILISKEYNIFNHILLSSWFFLLLFH